MDMGTADRYIRRSVAKRVSRNQCKRRRRDRFVSIPMYRFRISMHSQIAASGIRCTRKCSQATRCAKPMRQVCRAYHALSRCYQRRC